MAVVINTELDPVFLKALGYLHSKSKDSAEKLKTLLDESLCKGLDISYRPPQKDIELPKASKPKAEVKSSSSTPVSSILSKPLPPEKVKKEAEKRTADKMKVEIIDPVDIPKKPRLEKPEAHSSPITVQTSKDLSIPDLSSFDETSADDFAMEMGLACVVCRQMTVFSGNQLVECQECHNLYHQDCHKPQVTDKDVNDPRLVWYCARCTRQMKRMAQKNQKPSQKPAPTAASAATPVVKDPSVNKPEVKPKPDSNNTFLAFKRAEVKVSAAVSGNSSTTGVSSTAVSGLTGWAAFGAKTATAVPTSSKLGTTVQAASGKPPTLSTGQKPAGVSSLVSKAGSISKTTSGASNTSSTPLKPLPPLILGKTGLSRSMSNDSVNKVSLPSPSTTSSASANNISIQMSSNNGGGSSASSSGSSSSKVTAEQSGAKGPTSQESQLNAMKRLQMVKKKAAQKKLKK
ncbi:integrator complex subunit 12 [Bombina bombina]|uniref:integrator complex subunit 12 n=1 Tax=Bombina bombina TaxID=8345 RepID=UPI00235ACD4F|nr:integrator complex subunit 12 [Bombina bombina]